MDELNEATQNLQLQPEDDEDEMADRQPDEQSTSSESNKNATNHRAAVLTDKQLDGRTDTKGLHDAVRRRDSYGIQRILVSSQPQAVNITDEAGRTALHVAVYENCVQVRPLRHFFPCFYLFIPPTPPFLAIGTSWN